MKRRPIGPDPNWLDRHPNFPSLLFVLLPFIAHLPGLILKARTNPLWYFSNLSYGTRPGLISGQPFLDPNAGYTTQALGHLAAWDWLHGVVPWWNPYTGIGVPLAGEMQPGAFFLPFNLLLALPGGVFWLTVVMQTITGFTTHALLRVLGVSRLAALLGGTLYMLNGTIAWVPGPVSVFCSLPFLPMIVLGVEQAFRCQSERLFASRRQLGALLCVTGGIAWSVLAGFPETAFINGLLALAWTICRFLESRHKVRMILIVGAGGTLGLMLASPLLIAFLDALLTSNTIGQHAFGDAALSLGSMVAWLLPTALGPMNSGPDVLKGVWGSIGGYGAVGIVFLATVQLISPDRRSLAIRTLLMAWIAVCFCRTFGLPPIAGLINRVPLLDQFAIFRYAPPSWEFALVILAAFGLDRLKSARAVLIGPLSAGFVLLVTALALLVAWRSPLGLPHRWLVGSGLWALAILATATILTIGASAVWRRGALATLAIIECLGLFVLPQLSAARGGRLDLGAVAYLRDHAGLSRFVTFAPLAPNYSAYFEIAGINHNMLPVPALWTDFVERQLFPGFSKRDNGVVFWPALEVPYDRKSGIAALKTRKSAYLGVGVKYVVDAPGTKLGSLVDLPWPTGSNRPVALPPSAILSARLATIPLTHSVTVGRIGVLIATYGGKADGELVLTACSSHQCRSGRAALTGADDNASLSIALDQPLTLDDGASVDLTIQHQGGKEPVAIWVWPDQPGLARLTGRDDGSGVVQIDFELSGDTLGARRVYSGEAAQIWELEGSAPYFEVRPPEACTLRYTARESAALDCQHSATLIRRELFMPGWQASVDGVDTKIVADQEIFQAIDVPEGPSVVRFSYAPPGTLYGWLLALAASAAVLAIMFRYRASVRTPVVEADPSAKASPAAVGRPASFR